ncbi:MAG: threonine/serine exporter family protein [Bacillota bacterium]|nr:threonine/serine exporter family protein [Bacillota bacterium]
MEKTTQLLHLALDAGEVMIRNGAETFRVQDTMLRILSTSGQEQADAHALVTLLVATLPRENGSPISMMRAIHSRSTNFGKICAVNEMSRAFVSGAISLDEATARLDAIRRERAYLPPTRIIGYGMISCCFSFLRCHHLAISIVSFFTGLLAGILMLSLSSKKSAYFLPAFLCGGFIALLACLLAPLLPADSIDDIVIGGIMPLLPGVTFSKSMRDLMECNIISGYTAAVEALVAAASLAGGVGLVLSYYS